jgi:hypothetical protein
MGYMYDWQEHLQPAVCMPPVAAACHTHTHNASTMLAVRCSTANRPQQSRPAATQDHASSAYAGYQSTTPTPSASVGLHFTLQCPPQDMSIKHSLSSKKVEQ